MYILEVPLKTLAELTVSTAKSLAVRSALISHLALCSPIRIPRANNGHTFVRDLSMAESEYRTKVFRCDERIVGDVTSIPRFRYSIREGKMFEIACTPAKEEAFCFSVAFCVRRYIIAVRLSFVECCFDLCEQLLQLRFLEQEVPSPKL